jgi:mono/diheme cytochrome c family protein
MRIGSLAIGVVVLAAGCNLWPEAETVRDVPPDAGPAPDVRCGPAATSQPLPARADLFSSSAAAAAPTTMATRDLYELFKSTCGACHVEGSQGGFHVTPDTFPMLVGPNAVMRIKSDDPGYFMPPLAGGGKPFSSRMPTDPVVQLVGLLEQWMDQGRPSDSFTVAASGAGGAGAYLMSDWTIDHLTNLGDCVPTVDLVGGRKVHMDQRDAFFAAATELPDSLADTDLDTFDGAQLAGEGMIAYSPTYPLWTDNAGKLRYIRVPRGQSVQFDAAKQSFTIPPNTRFYKTFLKKVIDLQGYTSWRKIETRVIVSRPDQMMADGTFQPTALYGTYVWNDAETEAHLLRDPRRDGTPFRDRLISVTIDEPLAKLITDSHPSDLTYELEEAHTGVVRRYAIPGSARCVQCHMGREGFVLGFTPLQVRRRAGDEGGVYEPAMGDELTQLERLIGYGVISGMTSPDEVTPLETAEGSRTPRNEHELKAQAYMVGNCAHCHNPRGFPSVANRELAPVLNFLPSADGGIFQFPLDRMSPLRRRGANLDIAIPYITPSLREYPVAESSTDNWVEKWIDCQTGFMSPIYQRTDSGLTAYTPVCGSPGGVGHYSAPWRSLIYRNVDTPFSYADDFVIFPHMPMNSPGFDCRVPRIMGDWMVSIPARRKLPTVDEDAVPHAGVPGVVDDSPQPYEEVMPGEADYDHALAVRDARLDAYHQSPRYGFCPDDSDIVDHAVVDGRQLVPDADPVFDTIDPTKLVQPAMGVPSRAHWVITDLTEAPGDWFPRRPDWADILVKGLVDPSLTGDDLKAQEELVALLQGITLEPTIKSFATTAVPFGLWEQKTGCDFSKDPKVSQFTGATRPAWMDKANAPPDAPVYLESPGAAVFTTVCINCHGPKADSHGLLSDAILLMTGGDARVANLRDGLLGPLATPGANRMRVFGPSATTAVTADDWASRYLAWMTLGGTQRKLPPALLNIVAATRVFGASRQSNQISPTGSPNMLKLAKELCLNVLPSVDASYDLTNFFKDGHLSWGDQTGLIDVNGDAEMWLRMCSLNNRQIVRVPYVTEWTSSTKPALAPQESLYYADAYPASAPVLDHHGKIVNGVTADNLFPFCIRKPDDPAQLAIADAYLAAQVVKAPYCPPELFANNEQWKLVSSPNPDGPALPRVLTDARKWSVRGAVNAALSVFLYLDSIERGVVTPQPAYNHCENR